MVLVRIVCGAANPAGHFTAADGTGSKKRTLVEGMPIFSGADDLRGPEIQ
jgi:hypothetical protein